MVSAMTISESIAQGWQDPRLLPHPRRIDTERAVQRFQSELLAQLLDATTGGVSAQALERCKKFKVLAASQTPVEAPLFASTKPNYPLHLVGLAGHIVALYRHES